MDNCTCTRCHKGTGIEYPVGHDPNCPVHSLNRIDHLGKAVEGRAKDPTAQTLPLTKGQQIVAKYEMDMIAEPCELAAAIDDELAVLATRIVALEMALGQIVDIAEESQGVLGYHLNGDMAAWDEFEEITTARALLGRDDVPHD